MNQEELNHLRHSAAHLLAAAILQLYPKAKRAIGPAIENGFYFDFDFGDEKISEDDFPRIEQKMHEIVKDWQGFERHELTKEEALKEFKNNPYKRELIEEFTKNGEKITFYKSGDYWDLCKGGHIDTPKESLKYFKLLSIAGAYWRGDEKNPMLTRIYATAFPTKQELDDYLTMLSEAKKRDHKKLGKELDLFFFDETSPGMAYWLPKGLTLYNTLYGFARTMYAKFSYQEVATPQVNKKELYETSGHWQHYREDMFISPMSYLRGDSKEPLEGSEVFGIKPMNCPNAMRIFKHKTRSYRELPLRLAETTSLHRFELSGTLNGLFRTRQFRQDDAHSFLEDTQIKTEFDNILHMIEEIYQPFGLRYKFRFGTKPEKFLGEVKEWDKAEDALKTSLDASGKEYYVAPGEGAFYGPKVDILMKDSLGREWQTGTIQLDFQQPRRFGLTYFDANGNEKIPVVFHRAIFGSIERFLGILVEHYAGAFPLWLSPVQVLLLPIADRHNEYAEKVNQILHNKGIRSEVDIRPERLQAKIRDATLQKVPFMGIIGDKEMETVSSKPETYLTQVKLSVRTREGKDVGQVSVADFLQQLQQDIDKKI